MLEHYYAVIMAGGGGTRLWPLSRKERPKQVLSLFDDRSLFKTAVDRLEGLFPPERILVVTVREQADQLREHAPEIPDENYLIEPQPRGTASVVGLAAIALQQRDPEAAMAVLTSDHYIRDEESFRKVLHAAHEVAQENYLVTLGIQPTFPATGFGYIHQGEPLEEFASDGGLVFRSKGFVEKPAQGVAEEMLASGSYSWNSGMFVWRVERVLEEFARQMPDLYDSLMQIANAWGTGEQDVTVQTIWPTLRAQTIDYGIMEGAEQVAVIPAAGLGWSDVGSWDSLFDLLEGDEKGNIVIGGEHIALDTVSSLLFLEPSERLFVTIGLDDLVVVDTGDVVLIANRKQAQRVREIVEQLKESNSEYI